MERSEILKAVALLKAGELVAIPTETVYGLAADANNPQAVLKIFEVKERPIGHPIIVHIAHDRFLKDWAVDIPEEAYRLTQRFWPGPLTLILKRASHVPLIVTGGQETIGLRAPAHPMTQQLLQAFQGGLAAPSANKFGHVSPTRADHVREEFGDQVSFILEGGDCSVGIESTILDLSEDLPRILRLGMISAEEIERVLGRTVEQTEKNVPRVPGTLISHYAPHTRTALVGSDALNSTIQQQLSENVKIAIMAYHGIPSDLSNRVIWAQLPASPAEYARMLYHTLRDLDRLKIDRIIIEDVPENFQWQAIRDRLIRATAKAG